jgi:hypothetical protein
MKFKTKWLFLWLWALALPLFAAETPQREIVTTYTWGRNFLLQSNVVLGLNAALTNYSGPLLVGTNISALGTTTKGAAFGQNVQLTNADNGVAIGNSLTNSMNNTVNIGVNTVVSGDAGINVGYGNTVSGSFAATFGVAGSATHTDSYAIGRSASTTTTNQVRLGQASGSVSIPGTLDIGGGSSLTNYFTGVGTYDFASIPATTVTYTNLTVTGCGTNDFVSVCALGGTPGNAIILSAYIAATNTVTIQLYNTSAGGVDPPSLRYRVFVTR